MSSLPSDEIQNHDYQYEEEKILVNHGPLHFALSSGLFLRNQMQRDVTVASGGRDRHHKTQDYKRCSGFLAKDFFVTAITYD